MGENCDLALTATTHQARKIKTCDWQNKILSGELFLK